MDRHLCSAHLLAQQKHVSTEITPKAFRFSPQHISVYLNPWMPLLLPPVYIHLCQGTRVCCTSSVLGSTETSGLVLLSLWSGHCCTLLLCTEVLCSEMTGMWKKKKALGEPCKHPAHHSQGYLANKKLTACHLITKAITPRLAICKRDSKKMQDAFYLTKDEDLHLCLLSWEMLFLSLPWS